MEKEIAIKVENVSKTFTIPHEKISTLKGAFVSAFKSKSYEKFKALDDISFEVKKGEFFGIIGRNGSGKSTLLKILAGIYKPDKGGKIHINGRISPFLELGIGFNPELSGRDNIYLNAAVLGLTHKQIDGKFDDIVEFSELRRFIDQKVKNYSSGMQVRLAFSVAIHANREILLMDEVLAVGDENFQTKCLEEFNKYRDMGKTVILVSHNILTIEKYCDRAMLLRDGKNVIIDKPNKVTGKYIYQNIDDIEQRIHKPVKVETRQKIANLKGVAFFDTDYKPKKVFKVGDDMIVRVYFKVNDHTKKNLNFGVALFHEDGNYIFGINTLNDCDRSDIQKYIKNGYFEIIFKNLNFVSHSGYIKVGIWRDTLEQRVDFLDMSPTRFGIHRDSKNVGLMEYEYDWL